MQRTNNIAICGASGLIGGRLAKKFISEGFEVFAINRSLEKKLPLGVKKVEKLDLSLGDRVRQILSECDTVIYCAGSNSSECERDPKKAIIDNGIKVYEFAKLCASAKIRKFLYISTFHVYGSTLHGIINEDSPTQNSHPYATSRLTAEKLLEHLCSIVDMKFTSIRLANSFGLPHDKNVNCWNLFVNEQCMNLSRLGKIIINSNSDIKRDFIPLNLTCEKIIKLHANDVEQTVVNLGSNRTYSLREISEKIGDIYQKNWNKTLDIYENTAKRSRISDFEYRSKYIEKIKDDELEQSINSEIYNLINYCFRELR